MGDCFPLDVDNSTGCTTRGDLRKMKQHLAFDLHFPRPGPNKLKISQTMQHKLLHLGQLESLHPLLFVLMLIVKPEAKFVLWLFYKLTC